MVMNLLPTLQKRALKFKDHQLQLETEIITEDLRLLERVFYRFRKLAKVRKFNDLCQPIF